MKTPENIKLTTVGQLLGELKEYEEDRWDLCVVAWTEDDHTLGVVGIGKDKDGDLRIEVEEADDVLEGIWSVSDVISSLEDYDRDTRVYLAGHGLYFAIDSEGGVFTESDDDDVVGCYVAVFGEYEEEPEPLFFFSEKEDRQRKRRSIWKDRTKTWKGIAEGLTFLLCIPLTAYGLYYNIAALVKHTQPVWESILWIPFLALLLWLCIDNLFFPERND